MSSQHHVLLVLSYVLLVLLVKATGTQSTEETDSVFAPQWVNPQQMETGLLTVRVSLSVKFTCQATGNPIPTLHWFKNGEKIMMDQRPGEFKMGDSSWMLIMDFVVPSDRGNYTCVLENKHGRLEHTYHLDVVEFPHDSLILEEGLPANQTADVGSEVSFECEVKGNFPTELHWLKQAKFNNRSTASDGSPYVNVLKFQSIIGGLNVLTLRNITTEDAGKYICLAKNSKGASFNTAWLTVINDVQLLMVKKEELPPEQQERSPYPDQEDNESPFIKEEQEELWTGQGREQLQELEEADTKVLFPSVHMKSENDEEEPQSSLLHQRLTDHMETAAGGEDCGRPEPERSSDPERNLQPEIEVQTQKLYSCSECGETFTLQRYLKQHILRHTRVKPYICSVCGEGFCSVHLLDVHFSVHTGKKPYTCPECGEGYHYLASLEKHIVIHSDQRPFICCKCGRGFLSKISLVKHRTAHSIKKPYRCRECGDGFKSQCDLSIHVIRHKKPTKKQENLTKRREKLIKKREKLTEKQEKPFLCHVCDIRFSCKEDLKEHGSSHSNLKPCRCDECDERNLTTLMESHSDMVSNHLEEEPDVHNGVNESPLIKEEQEELWTGQRREQLQELEEADTKVLFPSVHMKSENDEEKPQSSLLHQRLTDHMETAAGGEDCGRPEPERSSDPERNLQPENEVQTQKLFRCSECGKTFTLKKNLQQHILRHTKEKPYICLKCGKGFNKKRNLNVHSSIHTGNKPYTCPECGKGYNHQSFLKKHVLKHLASRPFTCDKCGRGFFKKSGLVLHRLVHSNKKPYRCPECGDRFKRERDVSCHMKRHENLKKKTFLCRVCGIKFSCRQYLREHRLTHPVLKPCRCNECDERNRTALMESQLDILGDHLEEEPDVHSDVNESPLITEEQEELWTGQGREQLQELEEADTKVLFPSVHMKSENDEEEPESSLLHQRLTDQMETAAGGEDCGGPEPERSSDPERNLQPEIEVKIEASLDTGSEIEDRAGDWEETRDSPKRLKSAANNKTETVELHNRPESLKTNHVVSLPEKRPYICSECGEGFEKDLDLRGHMLDHFKRKTYSCPECGEVFNLKRHLAPHMLVHSKEKTYSCSECGKIFKRKSNMTKHKLLHLKEKTFSCSDCGKKFSRNADLTMHRFVHFKEKPFSCTDCGKRFCRNLTLVAHMVVHKKKHFTCIDCGKKFGRKSDLTTHMVVHTKEKHFSCAKCGKKFHHKKDLTAHMVVHTKKKRFRCTDCGKEFRHNSTLSAHMVVHHEEKCFSCTKCPKKFFYKKDLTAHRLVHTKR